MGTASDLGLLSGGVDVALLPLESVMASRLCRGVIGVVMLRCLESRVSSYALQHAASKDETFAVVLCSL